MAFFVSFSTFSNEKCSETMSCSLENLENKTQLNNKAKDWKLKSSKSEIYFEIIVEKIFLAFQALTKTFQVIVLFLKLVNF